MKLFDFSKNNSNNVVLPVRCDSCGEVISHGFSYNGQAFICWDCYYNVWFEPITGVEKIIEPILYIF